MISVIIKKELIENEKRKVIDGLNVRPDKLTFLEENVSVDKIFDFFKDTTSLFKIKEIIDSKNSQNKNWDEYADSVTDMIKLRIMTAFMQSAINIFSITETMDQNEIINHLIDLRTRGELDTLQAMIADTLELNN